MYVDKHQQNWDGYLGMVTHAYNTTVHATTLHTPYFLMFGRSPPSEKSTLLERSDVPEDELASRFARELTSTLDFAHARPVFVNVIANCRIFYMQPMWI